MDSNRPTIAIFLAHRADYVTWRIDIEGALRGFLFEKVLGVLIIEEEGEPNRAGLKGLGGGGGVASLSKVFQGDFLEAPNGSGLFTFCGPGALACA